MSSKKRKYYSKVKPSTGTVSRRFTLVFMGLVLSAILLGALAYGLAYIGSLFLSRNPHFELKNMIMSSDGRLSSDQLLEYAAVEPPLNLFAVDFDRVRENLLAVPWIESVRIQRKLPDTLVVQAVERTAMARIRQKKWGFPFLVDPHGIVMPSTRSGQSLPLIEGVKLEELRPGEQVIDSGVQYVLEILAAADTIGLGAQVHFESFNLRHSDFITARLHEGVTARFPRHSAREKLVRLVRVLQISREQGRPVKTVDLTPAGRNVPTTYQ